MNLIDYIILIPILFFVLIFSAYLLVNKLKGTPVTTCSYCKSKSAKKLLKEYRKMYPKSK